MPTIARLTDVGKRYVKYEDLPTLITGVRDMLKRGRRGSLWAVRHVDLEIGRGESIAIIGRNGSGKSTTLSILAGVTAPTEGIVQVNGRLAPLLRLGVGFDQELTGRENVYINGMILGMTSAEIDSRFDGIVAFAELEEFIDTPTKFYSSGMVVRLGFSCAVAADPDLLIVDEVLAVGDVSFQTRSFDRMLELKANGATLVVVSHNMHAVRRLADTAVVLEKGEVAFRGSTSDAISMYHDIQRHSVRSSVAIEGRETDDVRVVSFEMFDDSDQATANIAGGEIATFRMRVRFEHAVEEAIFGVQLLTDTGQIVYADHSAEDGHLSFEAGTEHMFKISVPMKLASGSYMMNGAVQWGKVVKQTAIAPPKILYVSGRKLVGGFADLGARFEMEDEPAAMESGTGAMLADSSIDADVAEARVPSAEPALPAEPRDQR